MSYALRSTDTGPAEDFGELPPHAITAQQAALALFKAIVGPGVLFLPAAVRNAGLLSASILSTITGTVSAWSMLLLLDAAKHLRRQGHEISGVGDIGAAAFGAPGRWAVDISIILAQLGFCTAYCVFVGENVQAVIFESFGGQPGDRGEAAASCELPGLLGEKVLIYVLILTIMPLMMPFTWIRRIKYFTRSNMVATALVILSTLYMIGIFAIHLALHGPKETQLFRVQGTLTYIGTAMYAFEGIGVLLPVERSMANPDALPTVVCWTIGGACALQVLFASMAYFVFGDDTRSIVTVNLGDGTLSLQGGHWAIQAVQVAWVVEVLLTFPLQMLPAARILESTFAAESRSQRKWTKNALRSGLLMVCILVSTVGYTSVDSLVSIVGAIGCIPLAVVYPALFHFKVHYSLCGNSRQILLPRQCTTADCSSPGCVDNITPDDSANGTQCNGKSIGSKWSDLAIVIGGSLSVGVAFVIAIDAWTQAHFSFKVCVLDDKMS